MAVHRVETGRLLALRLRALVAAWTPLRTFVILGAVLGAAYVVLVPPFQVPDEWSHFRRAFVVSTGSCVSPRVVDIPADYDRVYGLYQQRLESRPEARQAIQDLVPALRIPASSSADPIDRSAISATIYSCVPYLAEATAMAIVRTGGAGALVQLYAARLADLAMFVSIVALAIHIMPVLRWTCAAIGLLPMSLQQAGSTSADALTIACSLLFTALVLRLVFAEVTRPLIVGLVACAAVLGLSKFPGTLVLAPAIIPAARVGGRIRWVGLLVAVTAVSLVTAGLWGAANHAYSVEVGHAMENSVVSASGNVRYMLHDPLHVFTAFRNDVVLNAWFYMESFVGQLGYLTVALWPGYIWGALLALFGCSALASPNEPRLAFWQRLTAASIVIAGALAIWAVFYVTTTPVEKIVRTFTDGLGAFEGVQGRYFLPYALLGATAVYGLSRSTAADAIRASLAVAIGIAGLLASSLALFETEWRPSVLTIQGHPPRYVDATKLEGMIIEPESGPLVGSKQYVHDGMRFWLSDDRWFARHHRDPKAALILPADVVEHIVWGGVVDDPDADFIQTRVAHKYEGRLVRRSGSREIWAVFDGRRHLMVSPDVVTASGFPVLVVSGGEFESIPVGSPILRTHTYDGEVIAERGAGPDARLYVVRDGVRHWVLNRSWFLWHGFGQYPAVREIDPHTFDMLPIGDVYR